LAALSSATPRNAICAAVCPLPFPLLLPFPLPFSLPFRSGTVEPFPFGTTWLLDAFAASLPPSSPVA
jgi:hypothetical protein